MQRFERSQKSKEVHGATDNEDNRHRVIARVPLIECD